MIENVLAQRYAKALLSIAQEKNLIDRIGSEMALLADIFSSNKGQISVPELINVLGMPRISLKEKIRITDVMLEKLDFTKEVGDFLNVLITNNRVGLIGRIADFYCRRTAEMKGIASIKLETARALSEAELKDLCASLETALKRNVEISASTNEELIGGIRMRINDTLIDKSIDGALKRLKTRLR